MINNIGNDGSLNWIEKNVVYNKKDNKTLEVAIDYNFVALYSCNIKNDVVGVSIKIETDTKKLILMLVSIIEYNLTNSTIFFTTNDGSHYYLNFTSVDEAEKGLEKITLAIDGQTIACNEPLLTKELQIMPYSVVTRTISYPAIIFVDDLPIFEAYNKSDLIAKLNAKSNGNYNITNRVKNDLLNLDYYIYNENKIIKEIKILSKCLRVQIKGNNLFLKTDLNGIYVIQDSKEIIGVSNLYTFSDLSIKNVNIYFDGVACNEFEVNSCDSITFINTPLVNGVSEVPSIFSFKSSNIRLYNLDKLFLNSKNTLRNLTIIGGGTLPPLSIYPIVNLVIDTALNTSLSIPQTVLNLYLNSVTISSLTGTYPGLVYLKINNCGKLNTINLTAPIESLFLENVAINSDIIINNNSLKEIKIKKSNLTEINFSNSILENLKFVDISSNILISIDSYNSFIESLITNNKVNNGFLNIENDNIEFPSTTLSLLQELQTKSWLLSF